MNFLTLVWWLFLGHLVADYPLQTDFIAKYKSRLANIPQIPWYYVLLGHAGTHGAMVGLITGSMVFSAVETLLHFFIDWAKCEGKTNIHVDQVIHVTCKIGIALALTGGR